jgi:hypothetical protein
MTNLLTNPYRRGAETLLIHLGEDVGGWTSVANYDFQEYFARYQAQPPEPKYILFPLTNIGRDTLTLEVEFSFGSVTSTKTLTIPPHTFAKTSFVIPLPQNADATLRLLRFRQLSVPLSGAGADNWGIISLLGNIAKLAWVLGWEKDLIAQQLRDIQQQRCRIFARRFSLDKLGEDLRVPRFPPSEYSFDANTLALYHFTQGATSLSDAIDNVTTTINVTSTSGFPSSPPFQIQIDLEVMAVSAIAATTWTVTRSASPTPHAKGAVVTLLNIVVDETNRFGLPGHPGTNNGAQSGVNGKFGTGLQFPGPSGSGAIEISSHPDFEISGDRSFTVEAFIKSEPHDETRVVIAKGQQDATASLIGSGWSLSLGSFRGIANNVRWAVNDGTNTLEIFADDVVNVADGQFHHLAGTIDRDNRRARLFIDGEERATVDISEPRVITNNQPIRIARSNFGHQFVGVIDEVRLSKIARTEFYPVLGESDAVYRQRLGIFERWFLPTPEALLQTLNQLVQVIRREAGSFVTVNTPFELIEKDRPSASGSKLVRILPATLLAGQSIDRDGNLRSQEKDIIGVPEDDIEFKEIYLLRHDRPQVNYGSSENHRRMQLGTQLILDTLLDLLATAGVAGNLIIERSFEPTDKSLHRVGRSLLLRHQTLPPEELAVFAHRAGFDYVRNQGTQVYASVALGEKLAIAIEEVPLLPDVDVILGGEINLHIIPESLPRNGQIQWTLIDCGAGRARFAAHPDDALTLSTPVRSRPRLRLVTEASGNITVRVEYTLGRRTVTGTRTLRIGIQSLADGTTIAADGKLNVTEAEAVGDLGETINEIYLIFHNVPGVNYGADNNNHRMQIGLEKPLNRLLESIAGEDGQLEILKAYDPTDAGLHKAGRALRIRHSVVDGEQLGALAHLAGFGFVRRDGNEIYCSVAAGEKIAIVRANELAPLEDEMTVGETVAVRSRFSELPATGDYNWTREQIGYGRGSFDFVLRSQVNFTPLEPGFLLLNITYLEEDEQSTFPYTFEIKLKSELDVPEVIVPKDKYDLIMNILNYFHPIGVEIITQNIREHVVEVESDPLRVFPAYTYPDFRF